MVYFDNTTDTQRVHIPRTNIEASAYHPSTGGTERYYAGTNIEITPTNVINVTGLTEAIQETVTAMTLDYATTGQVETMISAATSDFVTSGDVQSQITSQTQNLVTSGDVETMISSATSGMASTQYVDGAVSGKADTTAVTQSINNALSSYTPTANFATINGSGITEGGNIVIEGGGGDENAQHKYTAATESDMNSLTGISEGDVCTVLPRYVQATDILSNDGYNMYDYLRLGYDFFSAMDIIGIGFRHRYRFTIIENPTYDPSQSQGEVPSGASMVFTVEDYSSGEGQRFFGVQCDNGGNWNYMNNKSDWIWDGISDNTAILDLSNFPQNNVGTGWQEAVMIPEMFSQYTNDVNPYYQYVFNIEVYQVAVTYQYNNGEWVKLANTDEVNEAKQQAEQAISIANGKLATGDMWYNSDPLSSLRYSSNGVYKINADEGGTWVDKGLLIHTYDTTDTDNNKYVRDLVTSKDALKMVALTQAEYDDLSTKDAHTLYLIIPDNS